MASVGIIANPASGKDIRRLVAHGSVFDNLEKVNIVRRVVLGLEAVGVNEVVFMPDYFGIGRRAIDGLQRLSIKASFLDIPLRGNVEDSIEAASIFNRMGIGCIVTLGGDGTNRAVAKGCDDTPLMPISTGTNNVFPSMIEGTIAGLAAGIVALKVFEPSRVTRRAKRLEVLRKGSITDIALVDVVVYDEAFIASKAIWDTMKVREIFLARAEPFNIGLSSIGGNLYCPQRDCHHGVYIQFGRGPMEVIAPIAPGLVDRLSITGYRLLGISEQVEVGFKPSLLALDGEREIEVGRDTDVWVRLSQEGPLVVDVGAVLEEAVRNGFFSEGKAPRGEGCALQNLCLTPCSLSRKGGVDGETSGDA